MYRQIIVASLIARPVRTLVSILAVALEVTLILVVVGLTTGISNETAQRVAGIGADIALQAPNSSVILSLNTATMPEALAEPISQVEGVEAVTPVLTLLNSEGGLGIVYGLDPESFDAVTGGFTWVEGRYFEAPNEVVVDDWYAAAENVGAGDPVKLLNQDFVISGVVRAGKGSRIYMSLDAAQELNGAMGRASLFYIRVRQVEDIDAVIARLGEILPNYPARNVHEWVSLMSASNLPGLDAFIRVVVFVAVSIGVLVIFLSMYTTITERTREIGILRSLGASRGLIVKLIFQESVAICLIGVAIGLILSIAVQNSVQFVFPTLVIKITGDWIARAFVFAVLSGILGALYPSMKAAAQDPVEALAYSNGAAADRRRG